MDPMDPIGPATVHLPITGNVEDVQDLTGMASLANDMTDMTCKHLLNLLISPCQVSQTPCDDDWIYWMIGFPPSATIL